MQSRVGLVQSAIMGQIVPDAVEEYVSRLNRVNDPVLMEIAREGAAARLPLIDADRRDADPRNRHGDRLLGDLARRSPSDERNAAHDGNERRAGEARATKLR